MPTVYDQAQRWAEDNFPNLDGKPYDPHFLVEECKRLLKEFPGIAREKWLFVYSPESVSPFFEVSDDYPRLMVACAKLGTVAREGGMLLGADFSEDGGGIFTPLVVCKP
jgi:hypothetical protein